MAADTPWPLPAALSPSYAEPLLPGEVLLDGLLTSRLGDVQLLLEDSGLPGGSVNHCCPPVYSYSSGNNKPMAPPGHKGMLCDVLLLLDRDPGRSESLPPPY